MSKEENIFTILSDYDEVAVASRMARDFYEKNDVSGSVCNEIEICLTEALNNIIKHSYKGENGNTIEIYLWFEPASLEIKIIDSGEPRKNFEKPVLDFDPNDIQNLPESGMGLFIINELMDQTDYFSINGKNIFVMKKKLSGSV